MLYDCTYTFPHTLSDEYVVTGLGNIEGTLALHAGNGNVRVPFLAPRFFCQGLLTGRHQVEHQS